MDFQSAARFGERRVMVTDYDETAVKVNAKVVDEDTGEVICESGGGGGVEWQTIFDEDITLTYHEADSQQGFPPNGEYRKEAFTGISDKYLKITFNNNIVIKGAVGPNSAFQTGVNGVEPVDFFSVSNETGEENYFSFLAERQSALPSPELKEYCSTAKRLKIEVL